MDKKIEYSTVEQQIKKLKSQHLHMEVVYIIIIVQDG